MVSVYLAVFPQVSHLCDWDGMIYPSVMLNSQDVSIHETWVFPALEYAQDLSIPGTWVFARLEDIFSNTSIHMSHNGRPSGRLTTLLACLDHFNFSMKIGKGACPAHGDSTEWNCDSAHSVNRT